MNSYFKWPVSQVPNNTTPTKTSQYQFYSKFNPEKSHYQDKTINQISSNKNEHISTQSINKQPINQLISKDHIKSIPYQVQIPQLSQQSIVNESNELKVIQLNKKLTLTQAQLINAQSQIISLNGIKIDLSQRLQKQQCLKVQYLQRIHKQQSEIFELRQNEKSLKQQINKLSEQSLRQLRIIEPQIRIQRNENNDKLQIKQIITSFNQTIMILQKQTILYKKQMGELSQKLLVLNNEISRYEQERVRMNNQKNIITNKLKQLQTYTKQLQQKNKQFNQTLQNIQDNLMNKSILQKEINKNLKFDKKQFDQQLEHYKNNQNILKSQINSLNNRNNQLCKEITQLKIQIGNQQSNITTTSNIQQNQLLQDQPNLQSLKYSNTIRISDINKGSNIKKGSNIIEGRRASVNGLWSPKGVNSSFSGYRSNAYLIRTQQKLNQTIFNNHYQVQKYKQKCYKLQNQLINLRQQYQGKSSSIQIMQEQLNEQNLRFNITIRTIQQKYKFEIQNLKYQIKNLQHNLTQYMQTNKRKNQQIKQKQSLLQRWVSQKNLIK